MRAVLLLAAALLALPFSAEAASNFTATKAPGPYAVGLRVVEQYDYSRGYGGAADPVTGKPVTGERARPIQTLIWYPAQSSGNALTLNDYLKLGASDDRFTLSQTEKAQAVDAYINGRTFRLSSERRQAELSAPMLAHADAAPVAGKFPVVIYAPSFGAWAFENADLCEYLASLGYVVIASPSIGADAREMTSDIAGINAQAGDISFLIGYAHSLPQADTSKVAVVGYSWGGISNVFVAARDSRITALVALDGSVRYWPDMITQSKFVTPAKVTAPLLYLAAHPVEIEQMTPGRDETTSFLNKMVYADVYRVTLNPLEHPNFSSIFDQRLLPDDRYHDYNKDEMSVAFGWLETYVGHYLDAYLKGDAAGMTFINQPASATGAPAHVLTTDIRKSTGAPPTRAAFAAEIARNDFATVDADYQALKARAPDFILAEDELNAWGYSLMALNKPKAAVAILQLAAKLNPASGNAFDSLGEAYAANGEKAKAIAAYRQSLVLDPKNGNAVAQLKVLSARK